MRRNGGIVGLHFYRVWGRDRITKAERVMQVCAYTRTSARWFASEWLFNAVIVGEMRVDE